MSKSSGSFIGSLLEILASLFGGKKPAPPPPPQPVSATPEPAQAVTSRVLMIVYDPIVEAASGLKLSQSMNWNRPEDLSSAFTGDILEVSGGLARYQIVQRIELNEFPMLVDDFQYTAASLRDVLNHTAPAHQPEGVNYLMLLARFNILQRVAANEIDEVWIFAYPYGGFAESIMAGYGAFFCNEKPLANTSQCPRRFVIMGFSYERGIGEMHESFGHRAESIMEKVYSRTAGTANLWQKFIRYDKANPGLSECGNIHFAPNSDKDYDWGNARFVDSRCDDWYNFPNFKNVVRKVNGTEWGNGEIRAHHKWWLKHFPKVGGRQANGIANNWWQYLIDPNKVSV
jgi:hypothetical protein